MSWRCQVAVVVRIIPQGDSSHDFEYEVYRVIVRKLRLQRGWSQDQLAELTGLSVRTVQRIERGNSPSLESARSLAAVFEVDITTFMTEDSDMQNIEQPPKANLEDDEREAIRYAKRVKEFYEGLIAYVILAIVFLFALGIGEFDGKGHVIFWVFLGVGVGLIAQGLMAFEVIRFERPDWEKRLIEKRLGRKL